MRARSLVFAALGAAFMLGAVAPAYADRDDWRRHDMRGYRDHDRDRDRDRGWRRDDWHDGYAPPVVVAPPAYYEPPPVFYNPGITFGFTFR